MIRAHVQQRKYRSRLAAALLCVVLAVPGCGRSREQDDPEAPTKIVTRLRDLHRQHSYRNMEPLVDPPRCRMLIDTLMAVDRLLLTASQLQQTAEQRLGPTAAVVCDISSLGDYLGPFSRKVQIISTRLQADTAFVAYQVGERVPIERAEVRHVSGQWRFMPDEPDPQLPDLLRHLTERMDALRTAAQAGTYSEQAFIEEYAAQVVTPLMAHLREVDRQRRERAKAATATQPS